jgi:hypothetical protein
LGPPIFGQMPHQHADVGERLLPNPIDQNLWAHWRNPMDLIFQG